MRRRINFLDSAPGYDSFLDVVCNVVGILIILVMIMGVRARNAFEVAKSAPPTAAVTAPVDIESPRKAVDALEGELRRVAIDMKVVSMAAAEKARDRQGLQNLVASAEAAIAAEREKLDASAREQFDLARELSNTQALLNEKLRIRDLAEQQAGAPVVLEHRPTPLAKTVFGREEHFQLKAGRLAFVPWNELIEQFKVDAQQKASKLRDVPEITETIGPLHDFRMRYTLQRKSYQVETKAGSVPREGVELERFVLVQVSDHVGEAFPQVLQDDSRFVSQISRLDPQRSTITVWVYPDSFAEFRQLKKYLFDRSFVVAGRPLPEDAPIGGSPRGSRSAGQ